MCSRQYNILSPPKILKLDTVNLLFEQFGIPNHFNTSTFQGGNNFRKAKVTELQSSHMIFSIVCCKA